MMHGHTNIKCELDLCFFLQLVKRSATERTKWPSACLVLTGRRSRNGNCWDFTFLKKKSLYFRL